MSEWFPVVDDLFIITPHYFWHGRATLNFMLKRFSKNEFKDQGIRNNDIALYIYV